jgi:2-polyprenyl-6-methoxyphenol hydroxylase-like FAD-dependent oxidoreductase
MRALIAGAGIGGLAAAVALRRAGWDVGVYERSSQPRELGFGLLLAANALAALQELGVDEAVRREGAANGWVEIRRLDGTCIRRLHAPIGGPSMVALRQTLHGSLLAAAGSDVLHLGREVVAVRASADGVRIDCADSTADEGDVLIGADGVGSVVRRTLHPEEPPPRPSGYTAVRGVAFGVASRLGGLSGILYLDRGIEAAAIRAATDAVYWYISLQTQNVTGRTATDVIQPLLPAVDRTYAEVLSATQPEDMRLDELLQRDPLDTWGHGPITLLGDAAHPMLPHTGQGAAQALEDAVALGLALRHGDPIAGLRRYEAIRARRTQAFVRLGPRIARVTTTTNPFVGVMRNAALRWLPERLLAVSTRALREDPHLPLRPSG